MDDDLISKLEELGIESFGIRRQTRGLEFIGKCRGGELQQGDTVQQTGQGLKGGIEGQAPRFHAIGRSHQSLDVIVLQGLQHRVEMVVTHGAEHVLYRLLLHPAGTMGDGLIKERKGVPHRPAGRLGDMAQGTGLEGHRLGFQETGQMTDDMPGWHLLEIELETPG
jgi:hypothetical protein